MKRFKYRIKNYRTYKRIAKVVLFLFCGDCNSNTYFNNIAIKHGIESLIYN
jgi:hypothetical protein